MALSEEERKARRKATLAKYNASDKRKAVNRAYMATYRGRESFAAYYAENRDRLREYQREYRRKLKILAMSGYSEDSAPKCACCGINTLEFLSIDHVSNDGGAKRKLNGSKEQGARLYKKIIDGGWPPEYQVLCFNCNLAKGFFGVCPHKSAQ